MERYDQWHKYNQIEFYLKDVKPDREQCRFIMLKVVEQVMRDYISYYRSTNLNDQEAWVTANDFLFDDEYLLFWGDMEISPAEFLNIVDLDINWVREQAKRKMSRIHGKKGSFDKR